MANTETAEGQLSDRPDVCRKDGLPYTSFALGLWRQNQVNEASQLHSFIIQLYYTRYLPD